jgi:hypothetical protein
MRRVSVPNTAALIVLLLATGGRIGELADLRWKMIREDEGYIIMPGTKTRHSLRVIPLQDVLRPWLPVLKRLTQPDGGQPVDHRPPAQTRAPGDLLLWYALRGEGDDLLVPDQTPGAPLGAEAFGLGEPALVARQLGAGAHAAAFASLLCRRVVHRAHGARGITQRGVVPEAESLERLDEVVHEVEAVGDLDGGGRAEPRALRIAAAAVPADERDPRVGAEPCGKCGRLPAGEEIDDASALQIDEHRAVALPPAHGPVIDAQHAGRRCLQRWGGAHDPEHGPGGARQAESRREACACSAAECEAEHLQQRRGAAGPAGVARGGRRQRLGEDAARAARQVAAEAAHRDAELHAHALPRQVGQRADIAALHPARHGAALRAGDPGPAGRRGDRDQVAVEGDLVEVELDGRRAERRRARHTAPA